MAVALQPAPEAPPAEAVAAMQTVLDSAVHAGVFPGAVLGLGDHHGLRIVAAAGHLTPGGASVNRETIYDLASLTKVVALTSSIMLLVDRGQIDLDSPAYLYLGEFEEVSRAVTVRHLLTHTSGLPSWRPFHLTTDSREDALDSLMSLRLESAPGARYMYSDPGAIVLGLIVEQVTGRTLDSFADSELFEPLGMTSTFFRPDSALHPRIAPTERDPWRGRIVVGEPHDENSHHLGGVAGHAGLFSTIDDLGVFAAWILRNLNSLAIYDGEPVVRRSTLREFTSRQDLPNGSTRALGWDTPSRDGYTSAGTMMGDASFGHTGYTGTSIWIDPEADRFVVLLSNRVHPTRENRQIVDFRPLATDVAMRSAGFRFDTRPGGF